MSVDVTKPERYALINPFTLESDRTIVRINRQGITDFYMVELYNGVRFTNVLLGNRLEGAFYLRDMSGEGLPNVETSDVNEYLDKTLGTYNGKPNKNNTLDLLLETRKDLENTLLKVESQAFAVFVKENKGTDIATDYYNFKKRL